MLVTPFMWHPAGGARQYEATGSRSSYSQKWDTVNSHSETNRQSLSNSLHLMFEVLNDQDKIRWLIGFETGTTMNERNRRRA
jgi:hypothetical protein